MNIPGIVWRHFVNGTSEGRMHLSDDMWVVFRLSEYNPLIGSFFDPGQLVFEEEKGAFSVDEGYFLPSILAEERYPELRKQYSQEQASAEAFTLSLESYIDWKTFGRFWGYRDFSVDAYYKNLRVSVDDLCPVDTRTVHHNEMCLNTLHELTEHIQSVLREVGLFSPELHQFTEVHEYPELWLYVVPSDVYIPDEMELGYGSVAKAS